jgi:hypothetical protein
MAAQAESLAQLVSFFRVHGVDDAPAQRYVTSSAKPVPHVPFQPAAHPARNGHGNGRELAGAAAGQDFTRF